MHTVVDVTDHALEQWRRRAAQYADADRDSIVEAFRVSALLRRGDLMYGVRRLPNSTYYFHPPSFCIFVVDSVSVDVARVVTVILPDSRMNDEKTPVTANDGLGHLPEPARSYLSLFQERQEIQHALGLMTKGTHRRREAVERLATVTLAMKSLRVAFYESAADVSEEEARLVIEKHERLRISQQELHLAMKVSLRGGMKYEELRKKNDKVTFDLMVNYPAFRRAVLTTRCGQTRWDVICKENARLALQVKELLAEVERLRGGKE